MRPFGKLTRLLVAAVGALCALAAQPAAAQLDSLILRDSFPLGAGGSALCQVQARGDDPMLSNPFDRAWAIVCRDSALPVGRIYALRGGDEAVEARLATARAEEVDCPAAAADVASGQLPRAVEMHCRRRDSALDYLVLATDQGRARWVAEGFTAYRSAIDLALRSLLANALQPGEVQVATTSVADSEAYARIQARTLDPQAALAEGYRRNNAGDYADAAAYFETLAQRGSTADVGNRAEFLINSGLQRSNLGQFTEADRLFAEAREIAASDTLTERKLRNFEAIHQLNQGRHESAIERLGRPLRRSLATGEEGLLEGLTVSATLARQINAGSRIVDALGMADETRLTEAEHAIILDAQADHLRGSALYFLDRRAEARRALETALARSTSVRNGRVVSIIRMRGQILTQLAQIAEDEGDLGRAESLLRSAANMVAVQYPDTRSLAAAQARLAAFYARHGRDADAAALYREVVERALERTDGLTGIANQMAPWFDLLVSRMGSDPGASAEFFTASQILVRPGVADTQAVLARELSAGSSDASRLFRQSVSLNRSVERLRIEKAALERAEGENAQPRRLAAVDRQLAELENEARATVAALNDFSRYRAVAQRALSERELQQSLAPDEIYVKLAVLDEDVFVYAATPEFATGYRSGVGARRMGRLVDAMRDTISRFEDGQYLTTPFAVEEARALYVALFGPIADRLDDGRHMIFEPDGAMLQLPANLLIADDASVTAYMAANEAPDADPFDVTMVNWLGSERMVSTAVSARAFVDARKLPGSTAPRAYLGMGNNQSLSGMDVNLSGIRGSSGEAGDGCEWPLAEWNKPISEAELVTATRLVEGSTDLMTGSNFTDTAIKARDDLEQFRILHFATHGLVTPPKPNCPARPALLTSFGGGESDGLLSFSEIFDLQLNADLVILSACDTAGEADVATTRAAGLGSGGGSALDGLVRSFVGAGGRAVLASHWPAPDDFEATGRLMAGLFEGARGQAMGLALLAAQKDLMRDPLTSHPYYWAGFAVIGDAARPLVGAGG